MLLVCILVVQWVHQSDRGSGLLQQVEDAEEALKNAALAGASTYAMGGKDFGKGFNFSTAGSPFRSPVTTDVVTGNPIKSIAKSDSSRYRYD